MSVSATVLEKVADIARGLLYERFPDDFVFDPIIPNPKIDHEGIEYLDIYIIYEGDYKNLDPIWMARLGHKMEPALLELGISETPSTSYIEKSEWEAGPPR